MQLKTYQYTKNNKWNQPLDETLDSPESLLILFGPAHSSDVSEAIIELHEKFSHSLAVGCSTSGEIFGEEISDNTLSLAVMKFTNSRIRQSVIPISSAQESLAAGKLIAQDLSAPDLKAVFILSDGLLVNGSALIEGLAQHLTENVIITGGLAGDGDRFEKTWVLANFEEMSGHVVAIGFYGDDVRIAHGSRGGWDVMGPDREVTRSAGNVLYELDRQPALALYKKYLGDRADGLPSTGLLFPLAIRNDEESDGRTVRTILGVNEDEQSITFAGDIPQGAYVQLMNANFDRLIDGASKAAEEITIDSGLKGDLLSVAISCVGRRLVLGQRTEEEIEATLEMFPKGTQQIGFYSYGEISPLASGRCDLHNQTMTLTLIGEAASA